MSNSRFLHLLHLPLLSLQVAEDGTVRSVFAPSCETQLLAALLSVLCSWTNGVSEIFALTYERNKLGLVTSCSRARIGDVSSSETGENLDELRR